MQKSDIFDMDMTESDTDFEFYSETSDSEDRYDTESIYDCHAQSLLSNLDESIDKIDGYLAFERGFSYGDIVRLASDPYGQIGQVVNIEMLVDLESSCGEIIENLNSKKLIRMRSFAEDDYVIYGPWIGKVVKVYDLVTILFDDGMKYTISTRDTPNVVPISTGFLEDGPYLYIPGKRVKVSRSSCFDSLWCGMWDGGHSKGTILIVESGPVLVSWISSVVLGSGIAPPDLVDAKDLSLLSCFPHVNWQLGDWCKLPFSNVKSSCQYAEMTAMDHGIPSINFQGASHMMRTERKINNLTLLYCITRTKTHLDVLWQDGSLSSGLDSQTLAPVGTVGDHDFWPGQFVLEKAPCNYPATVNAKHIGIVKSMDAMENTVTVKWSLQELNQSNNYSRVFSEESLSAYELMEHPNYSYCLGDIVFRLPMKNSSLDADMNSGFIANDYLSCIGNVVSRKEGLFEVKWASGTTSEVEPTEIFGIENFNIPSSIPVPHGAADEGTHCKKASIPDIELQQKNEKDLAEVAMNVNKNLNLCSGSFLYPSRAIAFLTNIASSWFRWSGSASRCNDVESGSSNVSGNWSTELDPTLLETTYIFDQCNATFGDEVAQNEMGQFSAVLNYLNSKQATSLADAEAKMENMQFTKFDMVIDCSDHHFVNAVDDSHLAKRAWQRRVLEEWKLLQKDLPDSISVRVYEDRMDLLRACIVGAEGTPYQDALFFFDICFPPDYPHEPPAVHYISGGLRLNPNLYESGKVCLSLLRTWTGTGTEVWDPENSTLLQVLLSLQALVLNSKPYFNEAGYDKQIGRAEGERNSTAYNENAFLLSRKSILYQLRRPPKHFEELVQQHYKSRSHAILTTCKNYIDGTKTSYNLRLGNNACDDERSTSTGFKMMLAKLFPMLVMAFSEGVDCNQLDGQATSPLVPGKEAGKEPLP